MSARTYWIYAGFLVGILLRGLFRTQLAILPDAVALALAAGVGGAVGFLTHLLVIRGSRKDDLIPNRKPTMSFRKYWGYAGAVIGILVWYRFNAWLEPDAVTLGLAVGAGMAVGLLAHTIASRTVFWTHGR
jgi:hypothetical protein